MFYFLFMCVGLCVCIKICYMYAVPLQKRVLNPLELGLQVVVNYHGCLSGSLEGQKAAQVY